MALRPARIYRQIKGPAYTRISYSNLSKNYIKGVPQPKITQFEMGNRNGSYDICLYLIAEEEGQIRHNALEAARVASNKYLEGEVGKNNYFLKVNVYPFHVLRENPLATGAGADRFQEGMRRAFGKPIGTAARVKKKQTIITIKTKKEFLEKAKEALRRAKAKLPMPCRIVVEEVGGVAS